jgi:hypothetical protein
VEISGFILVNVVCIVLKLLWFQELLFFNEKLKGFAKGSLCARKCE